MNTTLCRRLIFIHIQETERKVQIKQFIGIFQICFQDRTDPFQTIEKIAGALGVPAWTLFCEYSDNLRTNLSGSSDMIKLILKNKLSDAIEEVLG